MDPNYVKNIHCTVYQPFYIHNVMLSLYSGIFQWFKEDYYTEFNFSTMATHNKMQEELEQYQLNNENPNKPPLPAISFNPFGDIAVEDNFANLWRSSYLGPHVAQKLLSYEPVYRDDFFEFYIVYMKIKGNAELILWLSSLSEYLDHRLQLINWFHGGFQRRIRINSIPTEVIIPSNLVETAYQDEPYDWSQTDLTTKLIKTMNMNQYVYPLYLSPQIWLESISDASTIYGEDSLSEYKIQVTFTYNCMIPGYFIIKSNTRAKDMKVKMDFNPIVLENINKFEIHDDPDNDVIQIIPPKEIKVQVKDKTIVDTDYFHYEKDGKILSGQEFVPGSTPGPMGKVNVPEIFLPYMLPYTHQLIICSKESGGKTLEFDRLLKYTFTQDTEAGSLIDISSYNITDYLQVMIGDGTDVLIEGLHYRLLKNSNNIYDQVEIIKDVPAGVTWDFIIYKITN